MSASVNPTSAPPAAARATMPGYGVRKTKPKSQQIYEEINQSLNSQPRPSAAPPLVAQPATQQQTPTPAAAPQVAPSSAPPAAKGSVVNPTWKTYYDSRVTQLGPNATPQQLQALEAEADGKFARYADANAVAQASPQVMNQSNAAAAGAMQQNDAMRGRTVPQTPLLTPRPATSAPPAAAAPMFPPNAAAAGMANAINDANNNITSRGGGVVSTAQGGYIQNAPGGVKTVSSPYGRTGTGAGAAGYSVDTGKMGPGDANLRATNAYLNKYNPYDTSVDWSKQGGNAALTDDQINAAAGNDNVKRSHMADARAMERRAILAKRDSPAPPTVAAAPAPAAMAPKPAAAPLTAAAPPMARPSNTRPGVPVSAGLPKGMTVPKVTSAPPIPLAAAGGR